MSGQKAPTVERRLDSHHKLKSLVQARTRALVAFSRLASMRPFRSNQRLRHTLEAFCDALDEYMSSAHATLYRYIEAGDEKRRDVREVAEAVYPRIMKATGYILHFTERHGRGQRPGDFSTLAEELAELGEVLADRIFLEDKLLEVHVSARR